MKRRGSIYIDIKLQYTLKPIKNFEKGNLFKLLLTRKCIKAFLRKRRGSNLIILQKGIIYILMIFVIQIRIFTLIFINYLERIERI